MVDMTRLVAMGQRMGLAVYIKQAKDWRDEVKWAYDNIGDLQIALGLALDAGAGDAESAEDAQWKVREYWSYLADLEVERNCSPRFHGRRYRSFYAMARAEDL